MARGRGSGAWRARDCDGGAGSAGAHLEEVDDDEDGRDELHALLARALAEHEAEERQAGHEADVEEAAEAVAAPARADGDDADDGPSTSGEGRGRGGKRRCGCGGGSDGPCDRVRLCPSFCRSRCLGSSSSSHPSHAAAAPQPTFCSALAVVAAACSAGALLASHRLLFVYTRRIFLFLLLFGLWRVAA